jgi:hypothetical protein
MGYLDFPMHPLSTILSTAETSYRLIGHKQERQDYPSLGRRISTIPREKDDVPRENDDVRPSPEDFTQAKFKLTPFRGTCWGLCIVYSLQIPKVYCKLSLHNDSLTASQAADKEANRA